MSQLGATFNEELASLKAENTPETYFKIDSLHVKSRVSGTLSCLPLRRLISFFASRLAGSKRNSTSRLRR